MVNPLIVKDSGITVNKCVQNPGEFVVTKCASYHAGFNMGFNCAEAVNFALKNWISYGKNSKYCKCSKDNVKIEMNNFVKNLEDDGKILSKKTKRKEDVAENEVDNWLCCDSCNKWRKIPKSKISI